MKSKYQEFSALPIWTKPVWLENPDVEEENLLVNETDEFKWSGEIPPPAVGDRVKVYMNKMGIGTVTSYFAEHGWLGVLVKLEKPPVWMRKQNPKNDPVHIYGLDLTMRKIPTTK